jgi:nicotinamidase-related amidase
MVLCLLPFDRHREKTVKQIRRTNMSYERLTSDNAAVLFIDHQTGLANGVQTQSPPEFINNVRALVRIAQIYKLPSIITTSSHDGPNGPIMPAVSEGLPEATIVHRPGEINAWDNKDFVTAVKKIGRKKLLIAGISTEVCLAFVSLSARDAGYDVYAVLDASGTWNKLVEDGAIARMVQAGIVPMTWVGVGAELLVDWRSATGQAHAKLMADFLLFSGNNAVGFFAAKGSAHS